MRGEWLHTYPRGRRQVWFDRRDGEITFPGEGLRGEKLDLARRTRRDSLYLTVAAKFNQEQLFPVFEWFRDNLWLISPEWPDRGQRQSYTKDRVLRDPEFRDRVTRLLAVADMGITGIQLVPGTTDQIQFTHRAGEREIALAFDRESLGTRTLYPLSSFDPPPRKDDNIFRKYLLGIYGATPRVSSGEVAQALEEALA